MLSVDGLFYLEDIEEEDNLIEKDEFADFDGKMECISKKFDQEFDCYNVEVYD